MKKNVVFLCFLLVTGWCATAQMNPVKKASNGSGGSNSVIKQNQVITFPAIINKNFGDPAFPTTATASSGLAVSYTTSNYRVASVYRGLVTIRGAGTVTITAQQSGSYYHNPAPDVARTFTVFNELQLNGSTKWTFIKGDKVTDRNGVYGTRGISDVSNKPGARQEGSNWTDAAGNLWLFGGQSPAGFMNDMWKYSTASNEWTWIKGDNSANVNSSYGTLGIANVNNKPGARYGSISWKDNNGILWLFGGNGIANGSTGKLNDLWKYSTASNQWTWVKGENNVDENSSYGLMGITAGTNAPGARSGSISWTDASGQLWLFGGLNKDAELMNDLWRYDVVKNLWTWMGGDTTTNMQGVYGTKGVNNSLNKPGARHNSISWTDNAGNLWLFGGFGNAASANSGFLNDLWRYDVSAGEWTWINGDNNTAQNGVFGTRGTPNAANMPGARRGGTGWKDAFGNLWLFAGVGNVSGNIGYLNDMWRYNPDTNEWTWMKGDNAANVLAVYGTTGISDSANKPGSRHISNKWVDSHGNLWVFGGSGLTGGNLGYLNDLWRFSSKKDQVITFPAIGDKTTADTLFPSNASSSSGLLLTFTTSDYYIASVYRSNITVRGVGTVTLTAKQAGNMYYNPATNIPRTFNVTPSVPKGVTVIKKKESPKNNLGSRLSVYPNPAKEGVSLKIISKASANGNIIVMDAMGRQVLSQKQSLSAGDNLIQINTESWSRGNYTIQVINGDETLKTKLVKVN